MTNRKHTILVVDDDAATRRLLAVELAEAGFDAVEASSAHEGLVQVAQHRPSIVITDWLMPGVNGLDFCRVLRRDDPQTLRYVIMLTVNSQLPQLMQAFEAGVDDFLPKPIEPGLLLARMRAAVRLVEMDENLRTRNRQLEEANVRLAGLARTDELTGLTNRRDALEKLAGHWAAAERYGRPLACAILDIDHFKRLNDSYGHSAGDTVLHGVASVLRSVCRETDVVARYGGEEFMLILPDQSIAQARVAAVRCQEAIEAHRVAVDTHSLRTTVSIGVSARSDNTPTPEALIRSADRALYAAKAAGRNTVRIDEFLCPSP